MLLARRGASWVLTGGSLLAIAALAAWTWWPQPTVSPQAVYRIGYGSFPPYFVMPENGPATGFAVEVAREATRRLGMRVEWKRYSSTVDEALRDGELDLFPLMAMVPERVGKIEFSEPWWENTLVVVSKRALPIRAAADMAGKRISLIHASFGLPRMKAMYPQAVPVPEKEYTTVMEDLCLGRADGALLETRLASGLSLLPQCKGVELHMAWFPDLSLTYAVGARLGLRAEAERIQAEIVRMAQDGTMTKIGEPFGVQVTNQSKLLDRLVAGRMREQWWRDMLWGAALLLVVATGVSYHLRRARGKAERALAARSEFVANISHEIRTPLNGLLGMTQILRETRLDASQRECAEILDSSGQTLLALINQLLDFSKLEAGKLQVESLVFSPGRVAAEVVQLFDARASAQGVLLQCEIDDSVPAAVLGDPIRVRQILSNLVSNAVKFTPRGSIRLCVSKAKAVDRIRFEVIDTGCGIEPELMGRIFLPFTQADGSTSRKHGGTGLGLAISRDLATLLGGEIGVKSTPGAGSVFWVELPFGSTSEHAPEKLELGTGDAEPLGLHLLVAEDNMVNQHVLTSHLRKMGCTWTMTGNGREAVEAAERGRFDAVLMDGQMPVMDGFEATRQIRKLAAPHGRVPIVGVTACAFEEDRQRCLEAGMQSVLIKPFTSVGLRQILATVPKSTDSILRN